MLRGLRRPVSEGWAILGPLVVGSALAGMRDWRLGVGGLGLAAGVAAFLRDPERRVPACDAALAPADGRVVEIATRREPYFGVEMLELSIFLALWNVHVQRAPLSGRVVDVKVEAGAFRPALLAEAAHNHRHAIYLETDWGPCVVTLMAGILARRIVRWVEVGDAPRAGDRIGMIKFGSRVSLRVPAGCRPLVRVGEEVRAGLTPVAERG
ncbi:MAG TPA: phosphatidylserine decarboxylase [Chloroflexota bacterium]|jgi:phosphatidylserine decarboxylase|nr:phosphatidylserine decarboxylase [Chloroflexota bacterium]